MGIHIKLSKPSLNTPLEIPLLIIFGGESNSGGLAPNSSATTLELSSRSEIKLFKNDTQDGFYNLDIGVNNLVGHVGLQYVATTAHGWELQLANRIALGDLPNFTYVVKGGQGGSTAAMWIEGATYTAESNTVSPFNEFITRVNKARNLITLEKGVAPKLVLFWSQGINDRGIGTNQTIFKNAQKSIFNAIRTSLRYKIPIIMTSFEFVTGIDMSTVNTKIYEIENEMEEQVGKPLT